MGQATVLRWKTVYVSDHGLCVQAIGLVSMFIGLCNLPSLSHTILLFFYFSISIVYSCLIKIINNDLILVSLLLNFIAKRIIKTQIGFNNSKCREQKNWIRTQIVRLMNNLNIINQIKIKSRDKSTVCFAWSIAMKARRVDKSTHQVPIKTGSTILFKK
jgi:hypothetical protein